MKRILVTRGAGFIGSTVVRQLLRDTDATVINLKITYAASLASLADIADHSRHVLERADICDALGVQRNVFRRATDRNKRHWSLPLGIRSRSFDAVKPEYFASSKGDEDDVQWQYARRRNLGCHRSLSNVIEGVIRDLISIFPRVVVDDGSHDGTGDVAFRAGATVLRHAMNLGQTGLNYTLGKGAHYIATFDADGQHHPADILRMINRLEQAGADVALRSRFLGVAEGLGTAKRRLLRLAILFQHLKSGIQLTDAHNGLRVFTRSAAQVIRIRNGARVRNRPIKIPKGSCGSSKYRARSLTRTIRGRRGKDCPARFGSLRISPSRECTDDLPGLRYPGASGTDALCLPESARSPFVANSLLSLCIAGLLFAASPELANDVAHLVGIGRGADLVLYCFLLIALGAIPNLHLRLRSYQEKPDRTCACFGYRTGARPNGSALRY